MGRLQGEGKDECVIWSLRVGANSSIGYKCHCSGVDTVKSPEVPSCSHDSMILAPGNVTMQKQKPHFFLCVFIRIC